MAQSRVLIINGSYREGGIIDQSIDAMVEVLRAAGAQTEIVKLRDCPIEFCTNCRECALEPGSSPGRCVIDDAMHDVIDRIEASSACILAAPTNFGSVTAIFKRFMERLMPYAYWPWGKPWPVPRKAGKARKQALLISSSAAPAFIGRWLFASRRQLGLAARAIGAEPVGTLFAGRVGQGAQQRLTPKTLRAAGRLAGRLVENRGAAAGAD